jgi:hypothetical protein
MSLIPLAERVYHAGRTRPGLHPSMGSGQPAHPWAGLLLDRSSQRGQESAFYEGNEGGLDWGGENRDSVGRKRVRRRTPW